MLLSERELGISDEHDGIIEVKGKYKPRPGAIEDIKRSKQWASEKVKESKPHVEY